MSQRPFWKSPMHMLVIIFSVGIVTDPWVRER